MIFAGICAGGKGLRFGGDIPKQFLQLHGKPMIMHSAEAFLQLPEIDRIFVAVGTDWTEYCQELFSKYDVITVIEGGGTRGETVARIVDNAVSFGGGDNDIVATHDAARPFVTPEIIRRCIAAAEEYGVSGTAIPALDTVLRCEGGFVADAPNRDDMFLAQTPQCFKLGLFRQVWERLSDEAKAAATDVCGMMFRAGVNVKISQGDKRCFKITSKADLERAEQM